MEGLNRLSNLSASLHKSRQTLLPPIGALRNISPSYANPHGVVGSEATQKPKEEQSHHQRCSSESFLVEQPSWLDDLLNEPDTLVHKGHRRSASDSSAYLGSVAQIFNTNKEYSIKSSVAESSWGFHNLVPHIDPWHTSFEKLPSFSDKQHNRVCELSFNSLTSSTGHSPAKDCITRQSSVSSSSPKESEGLPSTALKKRDQEDCVFQIPECATERSNGLQTKPFMSKAEAKRAKQQSAHRSRVRKLQYIADLERNIQVLQAEGSEVSAAFEFLDQQNLILGMENRALRQRLDSLSQEHLIKLLEQDMLEREIARLQTLYQLQLQQQQQQQQAQQQHKHSRNRSRELDAQFANLSIKN